MINDLIADLLTRIRNGQRAGHKIVNVPKSKELAAVLKVLQDEGFVHSFEEISEEVRTNKGKVVNRAMYKVGLRYDINGEPAITEIKRVSKSGCRVYGQTTELPRVFSGLGISIISTSQGVISDSEARRRGIGGEVLATVF